MTATPLELFFADAWELFLDGECDGDVLQNAIEKAGLGEWRPATEAEIAEDRAKEFGGALSECEPGDPIMTLTEAGRAAIANVREAKTKEA